MAPFPSCQLFGQRLRGDNRSSNISCHSWMHWRVVVQPFISKYRFWTFLFAFSYFCDRQTLDCSSPRGKREQETRYRTGIAISMRSPHCRTALPYDSPKSKVRRTEGKKVFFFFSVSFTSVIFVSPFLWGFMCNSYFSLILLFIFLERMEKSICKNKDFFQGVAFFSFFKNIILND